jgi:hypothetical protein
MRETTNQTVLLRTRSIGPPVRLRILLYTQASIDYQFVFGFYRWSTRAVSGTGNTDFDGGPSRHGA